MSIYENGLYTSEFLNTVSYLCMSPPYYENNIFLDAITQFPDDGLIISI